MKVVFDIEAVEDIVSKLKINIYSQIDQEKLLKGEKGVFLPSVWQGDNAVEFHKNLDKALQRFDGNNVDYNKHIQYLERIKGKYSKLKEEVVKISQVLYADCFYNIGFLNNKYSALNPYGTQSSVNISSNWIEHVKKWIDVFNDCRRKLKEQAGRIKAAWRDGDESELLEALAKIDYFLIRIVSVFNSRMSAGMDNPGNVFWYDVEIKKKIDIDLDELIDIRKSLLNIDYLRDSNFEEIMNLLSSNFNLIEECSYVIKCMQFAIEILKKCCNYIDEVCKLYSAADIIGRDINIFFHDEVLNKQSALLFIESNWKLLSDDDKKKAIENIALTIAKDLGLNRMPEIVIEKDLKNPDGLNTGGNYYNVENIIKLNMDSISNNGAVALTHIAHELRHAWQYQRAVNPVTDLDKELAENIKNYVSLSVNPEGYRTQIMETDARSYANTVTELIGFKTEYIKDSDGKIVYKLVAI